MENEFETEVEQERTLDQIKESIQFNKRVIRALEIIFIIFLLGAISFFTKMIAYGSTALDVISYTLLLIALWKVWNTGQSYELYKFWDEIELLKHKEENNEKIS